MARTASRRLLLWSLGALLGAATACGVAAQSPGVTAPATIAPLDQSSAVATTTPTTTQAPPATTTAPPPVNTYVAPPPVDTHTVPLDTTTDNAVPQAGSTDCGADYYVNTDGQCVHRPEQAPAAPAGATAQCVDGTYSFSKHHSGTCSHHGGVWRGGLTRCGPGSPVPGRGPGVGAAAPDGTAAAAAGPG